MNSAHHKENSENYIENLEVSILDLEKKLSREKTPFSRKRLQERIKSLKDSYNKARKVSNLVVMEKKGNKISLAGISTALTNENKLFLENIRCSKITPGECAEAVIRDCCDIVVEDLRSDGPIFMENLHNCIIYCSAKQIRMDNCTNMWLICSSQTGIFLYGSNGVRIMEHKSSSTYRIYPNGFGKVYDLSSPLDSKNYIIIE